MGATTFTYGMGLRRVSRHLVARAGTVTMSTSYSTGGDTGFNPVVGKSVLTLDIEASLGRIFVYDDTNKKVLAYEDGATVTGPLDEVPAATNLSAAHGALRWSSLGKK